MGSQPEVGSPLFPGVSPCCVGGVGRQASRYRDERQGCPVRGRKRSIGVNGPRSFRTMRSVPDEAGHLLSSFLSSLGHLFYPLPCFVPFSCFPRYRWPAADRARFRLSLPFLFHFSPFPSISLYKISLLFFLISSQWCRFFLRLRRLRYPSSVLSVRPPFASVRPEAARQSLCSPP